MLLKYGIVPLIELSLFPFRKLLIEFLMVSTNPIFSIKK
nr:MAG TPA: hypothetical protein [Bacteriophage sp.]